MYFKRSKFGEIGWSKIEKAYTQLENVIEHINKLESFVLESDS